MSVLFGKFELLKRLASGGMGEVYLARPAGAEGFDQLLVLKTLLRTLSDSPEFRTMFLDEARLATRLDHDAVCRILETGEVDGSIYLAMAYVHGDDLRRIERACHAIGLDFPVPILVKVIAEAAGGLHHAHDLTDETGKPLGLVHRDVSPQNVLVDFDGSVKVIDFGVAKAAGRASHTRTGQLKGKVAYMSPEQAWGKEVDRRSDVFALGVILHELLVGRPLFKADSDLRTLRAVSECVVEAPSKLEERVPASLDPIVLKALAKEPEDRYGSAAELKEALDGWLVANGAGVGRAEIGKFLGEVFAERLAAERERGPLWDVEGKPLTAEPLDLVPGATGAGSRPRSGSGSRAGSGSGSGSAAGAPDGSRRTLAIAAAAVIAGAGGVGFALLGGSGAAGLTAPATSRLSVTTEPSGVSVALDGASLGTTPLSLQLPRRASAALVLSGPGLVPRTEKVALDHDVSLTLALEQEKVSLRLESEPPGATVKLAGALIGVTPTSWDAVAGEKLELAFELPGHEPKAEAVIAAAGLVVHPTLSPESKPAPGAPTARAAKPREPAGSRKDGAVVIPTFED